MVGGRSQDILSYQQLRGPLKSLTRGFIYLPHRFFNSCGWFHTLSVIITFPINNSFIIKYFSLLKKNKSQKQWTVQQNRPRQTKHTIVHVNSQWPWLQAPDLHKVEPGKIPAWLGSYFQLVALGKETVCFSSGMIPWEATHAPDGPTPIPMQVALNVTQWVLNKEKSTEVGREREGGLGDLEGRGKDRALDQNIIHIYKIVNSKYIKWHLLPLMSGDPLLEGYLLQCRYRDSSCGFLPPWCTCFSFSLIHYRVLLNPPVLSTLSSTCVQVCACLRLVGMFSPFTVDGVDRSMLVCLEWFSCSFGRHLWTLQPSLYYVPGAEMCVLHLS